MEKPEPLKHHTSLLDPRWLPDSPGAGLTEGFCSCGPQPGGKVYLLKRFVGLRPAPLLSGRSEQVSNVPADSRITQSHTWRS